MVKKVMAKFTGKDGSCGLKHGQTYLLELGINNDFNSIEVYMSRSRGYKFITEYSFGGFLNNWTDISTQV